MCGLCLRAMRRNWSRAEAIFPVDRGSGFVLPAHPKILILDDSTSAVDTATDARIRKAFAEELTGMTKLVIAQRISSVQEADKIIVLEEGRVAGIGTHAKLLASCGPYQEIYYSQKGGKVEREALSTIEFESAKAETGYQDE